jgi:hypothetical protein
MASATASALSLGSLMGHIVQHLDATAMFFVPPRITQWVYSAVLPSRLAFQKEVKSNGAARAIGRQIGRQPDLALRLSATGILGRQIGAEMASDLRLYPQ